MDNINVDALVVGGGIAGMQVALDLAGFVQPLSSHDSRHKELRILNLHGVSAKGAHANDAKIGITQCDGFGRAPFQIQVLPGTYIVHLGLKGSFAARAQLQQRGQERYVGRGDRMAARPEDV